MNDGEDVPSIQNSKQSLSLWIRQLLYVRETVSRTINDKISSKILLEIKPIDYHDRRNLQFLYANTITKILPFPGEKIR